MTTGGADRLRVCWRMAGVEKSSAAPRGIVGQPRVRLELLLASVLQAASPPKARELLLMRALCFLASVLPAASCLEGRVDGVEAAQSPG